MNAEEARKQSLKNAESEIKSVEKQISEAVSKGLVSYYWPISELKEGTINWLKENGYKFEKTAGRILISW